MVPSKKNTIKGEIVPGHQHALQTIKQQAPYFIEKGIERGVLCNGSINIDISPGKWKIIKPDLAIKNLVWKPDFPEDFNFVKIKIIFQGEIYPGYLYNPTRTPNPENIMEILSEYIEGIECGKKVELIFPEGRIRFLEGPFDE
jgi:hypothetical protein